MLDHVLRRCFEKDPDRRWQSIGDVTGELRWVRENPAAPPAPAVPPPANRRRVPVVALLALGAAFGAVVFAPLRSRPQPAASLPSLRFEIPTAPTDDSSLALSAGRDADRIRREPRAHPDVVGACARRRREPRARRHRRRQLSVLVAGRPHARFLRRRQAEAHRRQRWKAHGDYRCAERPRRHLERRRDHPVRLGVVRADHARLLSRRRRRARHRVGRNYWARSPLPAVSPRRQTVRLLVDARYRRHQRRVPDIARQDAAGSRRGEPGHRPLFSAGDASRRRAGRAAGVSLQSRGRSRAGRTGDRGAGLQLRLVQFRVRRVRYRSAGVPAWNGATPSTRLGQPARSADGDGRRAGDRFHCVARTEPGRAVGGRVPPAHRRQRHLDHRAGAPSGAPCHRRPTVGRASAVGSRQTARRVLLSPLRQRWSHAAVGHRRHPGTALRPRRDRCRPVVDARSPLRADSPHLCEDRSRPGCRRRRPGSRRR